MKGFRLPKNITCFDVLYIKHDGSVCLSDINYNKSIIIREDIIDISIGKTINYLHYYINDHIQCINDFIHDYTIQMRNAKIFKIPDNNVNISLLATSDYLKGGFEIIFQNGAYILFYPDEMLYPIKNSDILESYKFISS